MKTWICRLRSKWSGSIEVGLAGRSLSLDPEAPLLVRVALDALELPPLPATLLLSTAENAR